MSRGSRRPWPGTSSECASEGLERHPAVDLRIVRREPSLGLAPIICQQIFRTVRELNQNEGVTVFIVEQNAHAALDLAHRAYVMETGTINMSGDAKELRDDPRVKAAYLGE